MDNRNMAYHDFKSLNIDELVQTLKENGVAVITNIFDKQTCDSYMERTLECFGHLGTGITKETIKKNWKWTNLPPQSRTGMFQAVIGHIEPVWEIRKNQTIKEIFEQCYKKIKGLDESKELPLTVSIDGINIMPNSIGPKYTDTTKDWVHTDQTTRDDGMKCIQGSLSFTNTTAGFRCSPKSHLIYEQILDLNGNDKNDKSNWGKIKPEKVPEIKEMVEKIGGQYQIPIIVPAGSLILWFSTTLHSARHKIRNEAESKDDAWLGWRGVYYISYRPSSELTKRQKNQYEKNIKNNRIMNHWSNKTFPKNPAFRLNFDQAHPNIQKLIKNPELFYEMSGFNPSEFYST